MRATHVEAPPLRRAARRADIRIRVNDPVEPERSIRSKTRTRPRRTIRRLRSPAWRVRSRGPHAAGTAARGGHRRPGLRLGAAAGGEAAGALEAEQTRPDTAGQERTATSLAEALGHFGVQAKVIGTVAGPHITRYELRLAPGTKVGEGRAAEGRPRLRAGGDGHPHPRADPRQAGGGGRGPERAAAGS